MAAAFIEHRPRSTDPAAETRALHDRLGRRRSRRVQDASRRKGQGLRRWLRPRARCARTPSSNRDQPDHWRQGPLLISELGVAAHSRHAHYSGADVDHLSCPGRRSPFDRRLLRGFLRAGRGVLRGFFARAGRRRGGDGRGGDGRDAHGMILSEPACCGRSKLSYWPQGRLKGLGRCTA